MKKIYLIMISLLLVLTSCASKEEDHTVKKNKEEVQMKMTIDKTPVAVNWEDNDTINALKKIVQKDPLTIHMSMYGGFEQAGAIGTTLPNNDKRITTSAGDIVLYSSDQLVIFYGSNTWAYTKIGKITDRTAEELKDLLGTKDVTITISA